MRRIGVWALLTTALVRGGCAEGPNGPSQASIDNEPPYGPGAEVGETYDYVLSTHCGIKWTRIDGVWWETNPLNDGSGNPPPGWDNPWDAGEMKILDDDTAIYRGGPGAEVRFRRTRIVEAPFTCL